MFLPFLTFSSIAQSVDDFSWLEGTWQRQNTKPGSSAFETWNQSEGMLSGMGVTLKGTDTVFIEKLKIVNQKDTWYYVAEVSHNAAPTYFKITSFGKEGFVCENPDHDFPKKIVYALEDDRLIATISGDGKSIPFTFISVKDNSN